MAAITFTYAGKELTQVRAENPSPLAPIESGARVRVKQFSFTATDAVVAGSPVELLEFSNRVSILGGAVTNVSLSNSAEADFGYTLKSAPDDANSGVFATGLTDPANFNPVLVTTEGTTSFFLTTSVGALAEGDVIEGYVLYVENS